MRSLVFNLTLRNPTGRAANGLQCQTTVITTGCLIRLFSLCSQPYTFRVCLLQQNLPVVRPIDSCESHFTNEASGQSSETGLAISLSMKSFRSSEDNLSLRPIFQNRSFFQSFTFLNQLLNEPLTANFGLMNLESMLSVPTSTLSECRSEDPDDQVLNPHKRSAMSTPTT
jgi:hypothetical protein